MSYQRTALVVEDNEMNREMLCSVLEDTYHVIEAKNGKEGFEIIRKCGRDISIILTDLEMPVMNGYELLEAIRDDGVFKDIPIIVTTATVDEEEQIRCLGIGASDFLTKPYNARIIKKKCESLIRLREMATMLRNVERDANTGTYNKESFFVYASKMISENPSGTYDLVYLEIESAQLYIGRYGLQNFRKFEKELVDDMDEDFKRSVLLGRIDEGHFAMLMKHKTMSQHKEDTSLFGGFLKNETLPNVRVILGIYASIDDKMSISEALNNAMLSVDSIRGHYGTDLMIYDNTVRLRLERERILVETAQKAMDEKQFQVFYQPKHSLEDGRIGGAEALIRWFHPSMGFMNPSEFVPVFEKNGLIYEIDKFMVKSVCEDIKRWLECGQRVVPVSVNISQVDFDYPDLPNELEAIVDSFQIPHELIHFEITESANASDKEKKYKTVYSFCDKGFKLELDDFGTGYSSLSTLGELPIETMKIDMSLIQDMFEPKHYAILQGVLFTASRLGLTAVAEGVESEKQAVALKELVNKRCPVYIQGFWHSKPLPAPEFEKYLADKEIIAYEE